MTTFIEPTYGCFKEDGYGITTPVFTRYLGAKRAETKGYIIKGNIQFGTNAQMNAFNTWYVDVLHNGLDPFKIVLPFMGITRTLTVEFAEDTLSTTENAHMGSVAVSLRVNHIGLPI